MKQSIEKIPTWAFGYIFNGDMTGLTDEEVRMIDETLKSIGAELVCRHYKIFCVNGNTGFRNESRIFYFIHLQNEEAYERKESSSA